MFSFPDPEALKSLDSIIKKDSKFNSGQHNISIINPDMGTDYLRSLNVPFCINIMAGGCYSTRRMAAFTSISAKEHFCLDKQPFLFEGGFTHECSEMHQHDYFELMYVLDGEVEQHIEDGCFIYPKGTACILNRNTRHSEVLGESYHLAFLCLSREFLYDTINGIAKSEITQGEVYHFFANNLEGEAKYRKDYLDFKPIPSTFDNSERIDKIISKLEKELLLRQVGYPFWF